MSSVALRIRPAGPRDAAALAALAGRTFRDTYGGDYHPDADIEHYIAEHHTREAVARRLAAADVAVFLAEADDGELAGYVEVRESAAPPAVGAALPGARPVELGRLYVDRAWFGRGLAAALLEAAVAEAARRGAGVVWLVVWERNERAKAFYAKHGFRLAGRHPFRVGDHLYEDDLMLRRLGAAGAAGVEAR